MLEKRDVTVIRRVFKYFKPYWFLILISIFLSMILSSVPVLTLRYGRIFIDEVIKNRDFLLLRQVCLGVVMLYAANGLCRYVKDFIIRYISESVSREVRNQLYGKFTLFSFAYYVKTRIGHMMSRVINDVVSLNDGLIALTILAKEPLTALALLGYAFYLDWKLMCLAILIAPFVGGLFAIVGKKIQDYTRRTLERIADLSSALQETFSGIRVIKAFNLENKMKEKFGEENREYYRVRIKNARVEIISSPLVEVIAVTAGVLMLWLGAGKVLDGQITLGKLFAFLGAAGLLIDPLRKLNIANIRINTALAGAKRIFEILDDKEKIYVSSNPLKLTGVKHGIEFKNVSFKYEDNQVLDSISFRVMAGESIAFVGASGVGKTTLVNLIPRFYDTSGGEIIIDDTTLKEFDITSLRSQIALVTQETFLFNNTVYNNILYGNLNADQSEVERASRAANAHEFIEDLPHGYNTQLGDRGMNLSGGQRQRIAIARALLRNAPILILDEATSALDSEAEKLVQQAIERLMKGRTTFVIAHRLSTIRHADTIIVMKDGKIFERGNHRDLIAKEGEYRRFYRLQESAL